MIKQVKGLSLIEVMMTISILSIILVVIMNFVVDGLRIQRFINEQNDAIVESRKALNTMVSELREVLSGDTGAYPLEVLEDQRIIFYSDVDNDTYTERIRYQLVGLELIRGITEPTGDPLVYNKNNETTTTISHYIQNDTIPIFTYYNENYPDDMSTNPLAVPIDRSSVRMIGLHILTNVDPTRVPETKELQVFVHLRNLKENY